MPHATSFTSETSTPIEKQRNWKAMIISSVTGVVAAYLSLVVIAALLPPESRFIAGTTVTGISWGIATKVSGNMFGTERVAYILHQYTIQHSYRKAIERHIGTMLEDLATSIRTNNPFELQKRVSFEVDDETRFVDEKRRMFFDLSCKVVPHPGTSPRSLYQGVSVLDLPKYDDQTIEIRDFQTNSLFENLRHGVQEGTLLGLACGASASVMFLVFGTAGIFLGVLGAMKLVAQTNHHANHSAKPYKATLTKEFADEAYRHMMCLVDCAKSNTVGLEFDMQLWSAPVNMEALHPDYRTFKLIVRYNRTNGSSITQERRHRIRAGQQTKVANFSTSIYHRGRRHFRRGI
ncbi:hypothetical protein V8C35DRAFT_324854 [Trichoderma chlorosporum]